MVRSDLLEKALYIQFPLSRNVYKEYNVDGKDIIRLPLPSDGMMYNGWHLNSNHFVPLYHREYVLPLLDKLLCLGVDYNDFVLIDRRSGKFDISLYVPKSEYVFEAYGFTRGEHIDGLCFSDLISNSSKGGDITDYHRQFIYAHECSRIINKSVNNGRRLFISGDSQLIPDIAFLCCFFDEVWYFDNRRGLVLSDRWKDIEFTDVLIELNCNPLSRYIGDNLR